LDKTSLIIGSRGSRLAMRQAQEVVGALSPHFPAITLEVKAITTKGDTAWDQPLVRLGKGVFITELEEALLTGQIDVAVHSLKDLPTDLAPGLTLACYPMREDPRDVLVSKGKVPLDRLPWGARIGTGSPRRAAQLLALCPRVAVIPIRGNVDTRVRKGLDSDLDGVVLAAAGIKRLGLESEVSEFLPPEKFLPAIGQGVLGIEVRQDDKRTAEVLACINDSATEKSVRAERAFLAALGGGCRVPIAAYGQLKGDVLELQGLVATEDGTRIVRGSASGDSQDPEALGHKLAAELLKKGADQILNQAAE